MSEKKYITGSCLISPAGIYINGKPVYRQPAADAAAFLLAVYQHFQFSYPKFYKMDNLSKLGWLAAELLLDDKALRNTYPAEKIGLVLSNANSSLDADLRYLDTMAEAASPALFVYTLPNIVIGEICIRHQFKGENAFFISPEFDAALLADQVSLLMDTGVLQACLCGWVELVGQEYKTALYLVEQQATGTPAIEFSAAGLTQLFTIDHD